jgi:hypothetical protein
MFYQIHTNLAQVYMEYYYLEVNQKTFFVECLVVLLYRNNQYLSLYILEIDTSLRSILLYLSIHYYCIK